MPIYEFYCPKNQRIYSFLARSLAYSDKIPRCPDNPKWKLEKMLSSFAVTGRAKEQPEGAPGADADPEDPRMERMMAEMEREFSSIGDSDNPDPRFLGRMMRRVTEMACDRVPPEMNEMISRLEKGEDPDRLEAEYGEAMENFEQAFGDSPEGSDAKQALATLRRRKPRITRDPTLYEMSEYVE